MHKAKIIDFEEVALLTALRSGDKSAFEKIYKLYSMRIYWNIFKMVKSEPDAKELLQEVFLKVWEKRELIDPSQSFRSYLFQISKFAVYNFIRRNDLEKKIYDYLSHKNSELYNHVEEYFDVKEREQIINDAIALLPPQRKLVYSYVKKDGKTYAEVAALLGISSSTVKDHMIKATKFIKEKNAAIDNGLLTAIVAYVFHHL